MELEDTLTTLFRHNLWANLLLLESCADLNSNQMDAKIPGSLGSIRDTLQHIVTAEQSYYSRISTGQPRRGQGEQPQMSIPEMVEAMRTTGLGLIEWATKVQPEDTVQIVWDGVPSDVPMTIILTQVIIHAAEHREQVKATLTQLGIEPPDLQPWSYFDEQMDNN